MLSPSRHRVPASTLKLIRAEHAEVGRVYWYQRPSSRIRVLRIKDEREDIGECTFLAIDTSELVPLYPATLLWPCARCIKVSGVMNKGKPTASQLRGH